MEDIAAPAFLAGGLVAGELAEWVGGLVEDIAAPASP